MNLHGLAQMRAVCAGEEWPLQLVYKPYGGMTGKNQSLLHGILQRVRLLG